MTGRAGSDDTPDRVALAREIVQSVFSDAPLDKPAVLDRAAIQAAAARLGELYAEASPEERPGISEYAANLGMLEASLDLDG
jgi:hypothetical protein